MTVKELLDSLATQRCDVEEAFLIDDRLNTVIRIGRDDLIIKDYSGWGSMEVREWTVLTISPGTEVSLYIWVKE